MEIVTLHKENPMYTSYVNLILGQGALLCKGMVSYTYLKNEKVLNNANMIVVASTSTKLRSTSKIELHGFALIQKRQDSLYVDIICASGVGKKILKVVYKAGREMRKKFVTLSALPRVINFYRKEGFFHSENGCKENQLITRIAEQVSHLRFSDDKTAKTHDEFQELLLSLIRHRLVTDKRCRRIDSCSSMGYSMIKCIS
jgi:hypothetical protein